MITIFCLDLDFGRHRHRSNTAQRLQKMDEERKRASNTRHIKWEKCPVTLTGKKFKCLRLNMIVGYI